MPEPPTIVLGHGAGAGRDHPWMKRVAQGLTDRGVRVVTFNFPYIEAKRSVPDRGPVLEEAFVTAWTHAAGTARGPMFAGGKSMGGRIASLVASHGGFDPAPAGLVFFGYPLHPPGRPDRRRDAHLPAIRQPMLFLQGTRDPFGSADEMEALAATLGPRATLEIIAGGDHSLVAPKTADPRSVERAIEIAADWIRRTSQS